MIPTYAQVPESPQPSDVATLNKINQEHSNTRKFFSDELTRQRNEFYKQMDDRAIYYEETVNDMLTTMVWKLGLLWGGIVFFIVSFNNLVRNRLEKKRFKKLKESLKGEVLRDMVMNQAGKTDKQVRTPIFKSKAGYDVETDELFNTNKVMPPPPSPTMSWSERRREKVRAKKMMKFMKQKQKQEQEIRLKELQMRAKLGFPIEQPPQPQPQPQQPAPAPKEKTEVEYSNNFEVNY